jgi:hypothetical protein
MIKKQPGNVVEAYRCLIAAIIRQAIKDKAVWFLESQKGKSYCAVVGIDSGKFRGELLKTPGLLASEAKKHMGR